MKKALSVALVLVLVGAFSAHAQQGMQNRQSIHGVSSGGWSYLTAWNLSSGALQMSGSWWSGAHRFEHSAPYYREWIARFIYNQSTGRTAALAWFYAQPHVQ